MQLDVLLVDDSPAMRSFIRRVLKLSGLPVSRLREASGGAQALDLLRESSADLVLTDINMPEMDGEELLRHLSKEDALREIPVVVVSTDQTPAKIRTMMSLGARGYVTKPFTPETLRREVEKSLGVDLAVQ